MKWQLGYPTAIMYQKHSYRQWYSSGGHACDSLSSAYAQLGLSADASLDEVKGAYRRLALQCHPDLNKKDGQEFVRITAAYQRIMNKSAAYNSSSSSGRRYSPAVYSSSQSRFTPRASAVWGFGLGMGCVFFGAVLLWARAEIMHEPYQTSKRPSRVVEPSSNALKRERIAALLLERQRAKDNEEKNHNK